MENVACHRVLDRVSNAVAKSWCCVSELRLICPGFLRQHSQTTHPLTPPLFQKRGGRSTTRLVEGVSSRRQASTISINEFPTRDTGRPLNSLSSSYAIGIRRFTSPC